MFYTLRNTSDIFNLSKIIGLYIMRQETCPSVTLTHIEDANDLSNNIIFLANLLPSNHHTILIFAQ